MVIEYVEGVAGESGSGKWKMGVAECCGPLQQTMVAAAQDHKT